MASKLKWRTVIIVDGKEVPIASGGCGTFERYMPAEEFKPYEEKILDNIGRGMSRYMLGHSEASFWQEEAS